MPKFPKPTTSTRSSSGKVNPPKPVTGTKQRSLGGRIKAPKARAIKQVTRVHVRSNPHSRGLDPSDSSRAWRKLQSDYTPFFTDLILECLTEVLMEKGLLDLGEENDQV